MDRAKVICHMMTTIDGKIVIDWDGNKDYELAGEEYDRLIYTYAQAYGCGRATSQMDLDVDFSKYKDVPVKYEDKVIQPPEGTGLCVAFDRYGKLRWKSAVMSYGGQSNLMMEVLTEQVPPEFLAYLDVLGIPHLFAGKEDFDPELFLQKLKQLYHVDTFALCGSAEINAAFMRADMVDEISLVIGPGVDGNRNALTCIGSEDTAGFPKFYRLKEVRQIDGHGVVLRYER